MGEMFNEDIKSFLLIRNVRGNWSIQLLYEFLHRNHKQGTFAYLDLKKYEVFPPSKRAPIFINADTREKLRSLIFYKNPLPVEIYNQFLKLKVQICKPKGVRINLDTIRSISRFLLLKSLDEIIESDFKGSLSGKALGTTMISDLGVTKVKFTRIMRIRNIIFFYRFIVSYNAIRSVLLDSTHNISTLVIINGRDISGAAAQLCASNYGLKVVCLERGFPLEPGNPLYGEWHGNMHHWQVKQKSLDKVINENPLVSLAIAQEYLVSQLGRKSKYWMGSQTQEVYLNEFPQNFIVFFTTSEKETTLIPSMIDPQIPSNSCVLYDQSTQLKKVYLAARKFGLTLVVRLHPNFTNSKIARNEIVFFQNLTKDWEDTILIPNNSSDDSYDLASKARMSFLFMSTLSYQLDMMHLPYSITAPTLTTHLTPELLTLELDEICAAIERTNQISTEKSLVHFVSYMLYQGKPFESLIFTIGSHDHSNQTSFVALQGKYLDVPRFKRRHSRE